MLPSPGHHGSRRGIRGLGARHVGHHSRGHAQSIPATRPVAHARPDLGRRTAVSTACGIQSSGPSATRSTCGQRSWPMVTSRCGPSCASASWARVAGHACRCERARRNRTGSAPRSGSTNQGGGSTPSPPGSTPPPRGATSCAARSMPARPTSRPSSPTAPRCWAARFPIPRRAWRAPPRCAWRRWRWAVRWSWSRSRPWPPSVRGTSCSRGRSAGSTACARCCRRSPISASTSCTSRRSTPSAPRTARAGTTSSSPRRGDPGSPWAIGGARGWSHRGPPRAGHARRLRPPRRARARARARDRARLRRPVLARPPLAAEAPRVVPLAARRFDQVRREPAQALPGHRQLRLRRPEGEAAVGGAARRGRALDRPRRPDVPRRQPAHQAVRVLGVADRDRARRPPRGRCSSPRRSPVRR